jgi:2-phosphosulfolactate phosphatase
MPTIETIISPAIFHLYEEEIHHKNVVVIDILRATTTMCTAFKNGATEILPVAKPEDAAALQKMGWIAAAERHGETVPGFDLGNSPQDFTKESVNGKKIAITTTNGTRALQMCEAAKAVFVKKASHVKRFKSLHIESDLDVCLKIDSAPVLPVFKNGVIVQMNNEQTA